MPAEWRMKSSMRRKEFIDLILDSISDYFDIYHNYWFENHKFVIYYLPNDEHMRVGISVSKKLGHAVVRNKTKRQVRMMIQEVFDKDQKMDFIVIVRQKFLKSSYQENLKDLKYLYDKINKRMEK